MGFLNLKEFKEELSQAVNELVEEDNKKEDTNVSVDSEDIVVPDVEVSDNDIVNTFDDDESEADYESNIDMATLNEMFAEDNKATEKKSKSGNKKEKKESKETKAKKEEKMDKLDEELKNSEEIRNRNRQYEDIPDMGIASDEVAEITKGMSIEGNVTSDGSVNVNGKVKGDIKCNGKLVISGTVVGVSSASEIYTNNAKICGDVVSDGSVKVGSSSVIIGNVVGTSAVVGGAIKGDLDIKGPVIVDGSAVIQGNIKSRSVQINNGAVIEGVISQCYADVDYEALFDKTFSE
ncbi:MAG: polymer-forming cytoskeletal protein [Lachnospiraceae bacterium]|nr:polymer-forming cytoskeletal protein [Lachnospiraceae bacterium]